ncbi:type III-B CRISPR module RAMP protein Cmr4 [Gloeothece verrucosa]|uniref:CRISPR-associated RAMP protein, Cmr4 family n=1 Tax=Gloeothece verrucosa (strain PCC 7822) TaxID=497965 RepID=E0UMM4_GLOV7|nr:type III-B CRISPR module RAMP protein Cmr4 [Gloeothece verrucosa]ADN18204.1 CRISPR-associated RAMP protein, Cmr4 family [Gloeothece verrucosa PCC 7822]
MTQLNCVYLYLYSPLHTGGTTQEGNLVGIARESHTNLPYIPSSTIRGRLRASIEDKDLRVQLFGPELKDIAPPSNENLSNASEEVSNNSEADQTSNSNNLEQGDIWIGDGSLLWFPLASLSHGVVWITCPRLLQRWKRYYPSLADIPQAGYYTNLDTKNPIYLRDAVVKNGLNKWDKWDKFIPKGNVNTEIDSVLLLPNQHCATLIQMGLWRQVKIKLDEHKSVEGGFRYEEAIPSDTLMYFPWGLTAKVRDIDEIELENENGKKQKELHAKRIKLAQKSQIESPKDIEIVNKLFTKHLENKNQQILQIGGQESLGRGFVEQWIWNHKNTSEKTHSQPMEV